MSLYVRIFTALSVVAASLAFGAAFVQSPSAAVAEDCTPLELPPIDGRSLTTKYAGDLSVLQNNWTGFGDVAPPTPEDSEGNELDRMFLLNDDGYLYVGITGNTSRTDTDQNTVLFFIDTGDNGGTATLSTASDSDCCSTSDPLTVGCSDTPCNDCVVLDLPDCATEWTQDCVDYAYNECMADCPCSAPDTSAALRGMDGVTLDFAPEYAVAVWNEGGTQYGVLIDLTALPGVQGTPLTEGVDFAVDNSNLAGVNGEAANDPDQQSDNAETATTGFELKVSLTTLGITSADAVTVQAIIASWNGYISNQSLPPLDADDGGVVCVGEHNPDITPPYIVDFSDDLVFPGPQSFGYSLSSPGAAPTGLFDGADIPTHYGNEVARQNNHTCFGDARPYMPGVTGGSELDQIFISNDDNKLYIGVTGNVPSDEGDGNTIMVFIDTGEAGANELPTADFTGGSGALAGMDGVTFDDDFSPSWVLQYWRGGNRHNATLRAIRFDAVSFNLDFTTDPADHTNDLINAYSASLSNLFGVNDIEGDDPIRQEDLALSAAAGVQFSIRLADLTIYSPVAPWDTIRVAACISGGSGYVSNQWLPPLNPTVPPPVFSTDTFTPTLAIPDEGVASDTQALVNAGSIERVTGIEVTVDITHLEMEELIIDLVHDGSGRAVRLWEGSGSGEDMSTTFAEDGAELSTWTAPGAGDYAPFETLLTFSGVNPMEGTWTLFVQDTVSGNTGTLNSWSLDLRFDDGGAVGCLGQFDPVENIIDLVDYDGNQFFELALSPMTGSPSFVGSQNIPSAFLPNVALATQNNYSCFGDAVEAAPSNPPGSEMDQLFITNDNDRLKIAITGNLENNHNAFVVLLDTVAGEGLNEITGITAPPGPLGGNPPGDPGLNDLTLDAGFAADYGLVVHRNDPTAPGDDYSVYLTDLRTNFTRAIGRLIRNSGSGELLDALPNGNGSELDELFVQNDVDNLYIGVTGNLENNGNTYVIFLDTEDSLTTETLDTDYDGFSDEARALGGSVMDTGFTPDYLIVLHRNGGNYWAHLEDIRDWENPVITTLTYDTVIAANTYVGSNTNAVGVNDLVADDTQDVDPANGVMDQIDNAQTASAGVQFALDRASIGSPADLANIRMMALLNNGSGGWWSNQMLPGQGGGQPDFGNNHDLSGGDNQFVTYTLLDDGNYASPSTFDGLGIPVAMGTALLTQDNYTNWGDQSLPPNAGNENCMQVAFDDSNILGVTGENADAPETAETGMEFDIPFADIGLTDINEGGDGVEIKVMAVLTGRYGWLSNQFLPPLGEGDESNPENTRPFDLGASPYDSIVNYLAYTTQSVCNMTDPADIDGSGTFDLIADTDALVGVLLGTVTGDCPVAKADVNGDTFTDGRDIQAYLNLIIVP